MDANTVGATVPITFVVDANLFAPIAFLWSAHLLIGILRRWIIYRIFIKIMCSMI